MDNKKIVFYIIIIIILLSIIISEIKDFNKEYSEDEKNTKTHSRNALYNGIAALILILYLIYEDIKDLI